MEIAAAAAIGLTIVGSVTGAATTLAQGEFTAAQLEEDAAVRQAEHEISSRDRVRRLRLLIGQQQANAAASGVTLLGTPTQLMEQSLGEFAKKQTAESLATDLFVQRARNNAKFSRAQAEQAAFGTLLKGAASAAAMGFTFFGSAGAAAAEGASAVQTDAAGRVLGGI
jgi:hypothetical protein